MIDNYDSFTFILTDYFRRLGKEIKVFRHDEVTVEDVEEMNPEAIIISPGPKDPDHAGISIPVVERFAGKVPMLGVCLGHQAMGQVFGAKVVRASRLMHGKTSDIYHDQQGVFFNIPSPFKATRYHSLILDAETIPAELEVTAYTSQGEIMGIRHSGFLMEGVQFHPESILTENGELLLANFLQEVSSWKGDLINANYNR